MENRDKINAVQRMQDYIVSHINEEITMQDLSNVFCFKNITQQIIKNSLWNLSV